MFESIGAMATIFIVVFLIFLGILGVLMPLFIYQMKNELVKIRTVIDSLGEEITIIEQKRIKAEKITEAKKREINKLKWQAVKKKEDAAYGAAAGKLKSTKTAHGKQNKKSKE